MSENIAEIPRHIAIIMDGNGRWAKERGMIRVKGHNAGMASLKKTVRACAELGVKYLTVYAFSTENWRRPVDEVNGIFKIMVYYIKKELKELKEENVRVNVIGDWEAIPEDAREKMLYAVDETAENTGLVFTIALNYGGRREILNAVKALYKEIMEADAAEDVEKPDAAEKISELDAAEEISEPDAAEKISEFDAAENITEADIERHLATAGMPDPDIIIRTGGEMRLSNFLLWQCAYSEFIFRDVYWPDFDKAELVSCIEEFNRRNRRYGGLS